MAAGLLRDRITFKQKVETADGQGGHSAAWVAQFTVWGSFRPARGREQIEAGRLESSVEGTMRVRSSSDTQRIEADWIAVLDGVDYNIRWVTNPDRHSRFLELAVQRGVAV
jgi:SPP1 family predicted phage head-tail adaptor